MLLNGKLIAVIVSRYDGDGAEALCGIRQVGGITIAQQLDTASQPDMPKSAIAIGCIDFFCRQRILRKNSRESRTLKSKIDYSIISILRRASEVWLTDVTVLLIDPQPYDRLCWWLVEGHYSEAGKYFSRAKQKWAARASPQDPLTLLVFLKTWV